MYFQLNEFDENLPRQICDQCKMQVINFYSFKRKSKRVEEALETVIKKSTVELKNEEIETPQIVTEEIVECLTENEDVGDDVIEYDIQESPIIANVTIEELILKNDELTQLLEPETVKSEMTETIIPLNSTDYPQTPNDVNVCGICGRSFETSNNLGK